MAWYQWVGIVWVACGLAVLLLLNWAQRHSPMDPSEEGEDTFPEDWNFPARDTTTVRHGGLGR